MRIDILTLFPDMCERVMDESIIGRARKAGYVDLHTRHIRDYTADKHGRTDDYPYGGGKGMLMTAQPIDACFASLTEELGTRPYLIYLSPCGETLTQEKVKELSKKDNIALLCGHYEGVDQRILDKLVDEEISIGDYVLTGGELPALVLTDALCRMCPGVLDEEVCFTEESHFAGLLEYPQYTRPPVYDGMAVPEVLLSGDHLMVDAWRKEEALRRTKERRPDLMEAYTLTDEDKRLLKVLEKRRKMEASVEEEKDKNCSQNMP